MLHHCAIAPGVTLRCQAAILQAFHSILHCIASSTVHAPWMPSDQGVDASPLILGCSLSPSNTFSRAVRSGSTLGAPGIFFSPSD
jgi:hypothetical protein